ncbi:MAG TPA: hypothetical protein DCM34_02165 [Salmonella bongori]|uniref:Uncharacterized protein n=1 Tax=Salmonella bongori serovar 66:z41:- str. SA19983605 TaxID=1243617 RepID=A0A248K6P9_SALBN|nr:hypothetical protein LFZ56_03590 [Salmonella bongori serovar 66:z41:- str. SA19983605]ECC9751748.1 hypothetical protein [Salmonella bongori]HAD92404.1 hypothetical protein [Salmonella bongori]HAK48061.1 hypothetical protein [Salmonella bongori]HBD13793.1 hypothetical protein [Salmonella bongori]
MIQQGYYLALINYTISSSLRFTVLPKYHGVHNHKKSVVNGAPIAITFSRTVQNKRQVFVTE